MLDPSQTNLRLYWQSLRSGPPPPSRDRIDLSLLGDAAGIILLHRSPGAATRLRRSTPALTRLSGMELKATPFATLFCPGSRLALEQALSDVLDRGRQAVLAVRADAGGNLLKGTILLLPLRARRPDVAEALGAVHLEGELTGHDRLALSGVRLLALPALQQNQPSGLAESAPGFRHRIRSSSGPHNQGSATIQGDATGRGDATTPPPCSVCGRP